MTEDVQIDADELLGPRKPGPKADTLERAKTYLRDYLLGRAQTQAGHPRSGEGSASIRSLDRACFRGVRSFQSQTARNASGVFLRSEVLGNLANMARMVPNVTHSPSSPSVL